MKKILLLFLGILFCKAQAYNIWVKNSTGKNLRVRIDSVPGCAEPNHGNESDQNPLAAFQEDFWPTHSKCDDIPVTIYDPVYGQTISVNAKLHYRSFEVFEVLKHGKLEFAIKLYGKN